MVCGARQVGKTTLLRNAVENGRVGMPNDEARNNMSSVKVLCQLRLSTH